MGKPGNEDNVMQVIRRTGNQKADDRKRKAEDVILISMAFGILGENKVNAESFSAKQSQFARGAKFR